MVDQRDGIELTDEELRAALSRRPKVPFNNEETELLREMATWYKARRDDLAARQARRAAWKARFPIIFAGLSALITAVTFVVNNFYTHRSP